MTGNNGILHRSGARRHMGRNMIESVTIKGYRGFSHFEMKGLGRINLLVGRNNGGKTSILEAIYLLASGPDPYALWRVVSRRGERVASSPQARGAPELEMDLSHVFFGHEIKLGQSFVITTKNDEQRSIICGISEGTKDAQERAALESEGLSRVFLSISDGGTKKGAAQIPLTRRGGLRLDSLDSPTRARRGLLFSDSTNQTQFVSTESLSPELLSSMWNHIALTEAQDMVVRALKFVEPKIEAIAPQIQSDSYYFGGTRGAFIVRLKDVNRPIPIGSLGDGTWRILALAIALSQARGGILLVDEIDTGLHHSVLGDMWTLIDQTARELDVQIFATTHSSDCVTSLANICAGRNGNDVTIQRIETGKTEGVRYSEAQVLMAAERNIEVR